MNKKKTADVKPIAMAVAFIAVFAVALFFAIASLGGAKGEAKLAPGAPESIASAGAPRSQLELKRMFEAMSLTYTENGRTVYEPISREYRAALEERIAAGESPALSVEEILFIVSDSAAAYDRFDIIRFRNADGETEGEIYPQEVSQTREMSFGRSALERIREVSTLIELRVRKMSAPSSFEETDDGSIYTSRRVEREKNDEIGGGVSFAFEPFGKDGFGEISFLPGDGTKVTVYPSDAEVSLCRTRVIAHTDIPASAEERELLFSVGVEPDRCRNITPEYFYGRTELRLFALGGEVVLVDVELDKAIPLLGGEERFSSVALGADGLYYTTLSDGGSSVCKYSSGRIELLFSSDSQLAVTEPLSGEFHSVLVYKAERRENESFVTAFECIGDPIAEYFAE